MSEEQTVAVLMLLAGAALLYFFGWRAALLVAPYSVRVEVETPADATRVPDELADAVSELKRLGFALLGGHSERFLFRATRPYVDLKRDDVVASLTVGRDEQDELTLWTCCGEGFVVTSNFKRPAREVRGWYLGGGIDGAAPERLLNVHLRRVNEVGQSTPRADLEAHVAAVRRWFVTQGKPELREQHALALLWSLGALGMVGAALNRLLN